MPGRREDAIVSSLVKGRQAQALHTQTCLSCPSERAVCLLRDRIQNLAEAIIFKCNFIAERPESTVGSLQISANTLLSQTDRAAIFPPAIRGDLRRLGISQWRATTGLFQDLTAF